MSGAVSYLDLCAQSARQTLDALSADATRWSSAITLLTGDSFGRESVRLTRALGFASPDAANLPHGPQYDRPVDAADLVRELSERHPDGAGGLELAMLALGDSGPLNSTAGRIRGLYGLRHDKVVRAAQAVRAVSIATVRSAIVRASVERPSELRTPGMSFDVGSGVVATASIGLHRLLARADNLRQMAGRDTITSLDLLRASLPLWSDPTIEQLVVGIAVGGRCRRVPRSAGQDAVPVALHARGPAGAACRPPGPLPPPRRTAVGGAADRSTGKGPTGCEVAHPCARKPIVGMPPRRRISKAQEVA